MRRCSSWRPTTGRARRRVEHLALLDALDVRPRDRRHHEDRRRRAASGWPCVARRSRRCSPATSPGRRRRPVRLGDDGPGARRAARGPGLDRGGVRRRGPGPPTLAIDRVFAVKGRGTVVTGTLRGGPLGAWRSPSARAGRPRRPRPRDPGPWRDGRTARGAAGAPRSTSAGSSSRRSTAGTCSPPTRRSGPPAGCSSPSADPSPIGPAPACTPGPRRSMPRWDGPVGMRSSSRTARSRVSSGWRRRSPWPPATASCCGAVRAGSRWAA